MGTKILQNSFTGGEVSPELLGRTDDRGYQAGAQKIENFIVLPQGMIRSRPGFRFVTETLDSSKPVRLIPFRYASNQTLVLIFGEKTMQIATGGSMVLKSDGTVYTIATPYYAADLQFLDFSQNADVLTITSPYYAPTELRRYGATDWRFVTVNVGAKIAPPASVSTTPIYANYMTDAENKDKDKISATYVVTAFDSDQNESRASGAVTGRGNYYISGCAIRISWSAVAGAVRYRVYRLTSGVYGYIGQTEALSLDDVGNLPDTSTTPPKFTSPFASAVGTVESATVTNAGADYYPYPSSIVAKVTRTYDDTTTTTVYASTDDYEEGTITGTEDGKSYTQTVVYVRYYPETKQECDQDKYLYPQQYTYALRITDASGSGASGYCVVDTSGEVKGAVITAGGSGYVNPQASITGTNRGSGATFRLNLNYTSKATSYPSANTEFDQRRVFAGTLGDPLKIWFTNAGKQDSMLYHLPVLDDDRIEITALTSDADRIKHAVSLSSLILFTGSSELRVYTQNSDSLTPKSVAVRVQSYIGANDVQPIIANNQIIYAASRGGHPYAMGYDSNADGFLTVDLSIRCPALFDGYNIVDLALCKSPTMIVWAVSSNGKLLGCSYNPVQNVTGWFEVTTDGSFESICCVSEGNEDHLYATINRNGRRYIERMENINIGASRENWRYLDSYLDGRFTKAQTKISGLNHLEGKEVSVYVDGKQQTNKTVSGGSITLDSEGYNIAVGIPYKSVLITLPLAQTATTDDLQGRIKNISEAFFRVSGEGDLFADSYPENNLWECKKDDKYLQPQNSESYLAQISLSGSWDYQGQIKAEHRNAKPLEISAVILNADVTEKREYPSMNTNPSNND